MRNNIPEVDDLVIYNPEVVDHEGNWGLDGKILQVTHVEEDEDYPTCVKVKFHVQGDPKDWGYLSIEKNTGYWNKGQIGKPFFLLAEGDTTQHNLYIKVEENNPDLYCICGGPTKTSYTLNKSFKVCTICKKEAI